MARRDDADAPKPDPAQPMGVPVRKKKAPATMSVAGAFPISIEIGRAHV